MENTVKNQVIIKTLIVEGLDIYVCEINNKIVAKSHSVVGVKLKVLKLVRKMKRFEFPKIMNDFAL